MDNKPQFIARKFQNAQRLAAKGYLLCPLCDEKFQEGKKLWAHGKIQHHQASSATDAEEARLRKHFLQEATEKTYVNTPENDLDCLGTLQVQWLVVGTC